MIDEPIRLIGVARLRQAAALFAQERDGERFHSRKSFAMALGGKVLELAERLSSDGAFMQERARKLERCVGNTGVMIEDSQAVPIQGSTGIGDAGLGLPTS